MKRITIVGTMIPLAVIALFYVWSTGPVEFKSKVKQDVLGVESSEIYQTIQNPYVTIDIPSRYILKNSTKPAAQNSAIFLQQLFGVSASSAASLASDQLALTVGASQQENLEDISSLKLRQHSSMYKEVDLGLGPNVMAFESDQQNYELSIFTRNGNTYIAIVQTVQIAKKESSLNEMKHAVQSLRWQ